MHSEGCIELELTQPDGRRPSMEDGLRLKMTFDERRPSMEDNNEDDLKNKEDLHIAGRYTALDIFRFAVFFLSKVLRNKNEKKLSLLQTALSETLFCFANISAP